MAAVVAARDEAARQQRLTQAAADAIGQWFLEARILEKKVGQLRMEELQDIATAAISGYQIQLSREERPSAPPRVVPTLG